MEEMLQQVAQMLQQGAQPEDVMNHLMEQGVPQEQIVQLIQAAVQQIGGGQEQQSQPIMQEGSTFVPRNTTAEDYPYAAPGTPDWEASQAQNKAYTDKYTYPFKLGYYSPTGSLNGMPFIDPKDNSSFGQGFSDKINRFAKTPPGLPKLKAIQQQNNEYNKINKYQEEYQEGGLVSRFQEYSDTPSYLEGGSARDRARKYLETFQSGDTYTGPRKGHYEGSDVGELIENAGDEGHFNMGEVEDILHGLGNDFRFKYDRDGNIKKIKTRGRKWKFDEDGGLRKDRRNRRYSDLGYDFDYMPDNEYYDEDEIDDSTDTYSNSDDQYFADQADARKAVNYDQDLEQAEAEAYDPNPVKADTPTFRNRGEAYNYYRNRGDEEFTYNGDRYHTRSAEEEAARRSNPSTRRTSPAKKRIYKKPTTTRTSPARTRTSPTRTTPARTTPARTTPARTTPATTSPATTSPARTSPARTTPAKTRTSPATTSPARTSPAKKTYQNMTWQERRKAMNTDKYHSKTPAKKTYQNMTWQERRKAMNTDKYHSKTPARTTPATTRTTPATTRTTPATTRTTPAKKRIYKKPTTTKKRIHPRASEGYRYSTRNEYRVHKSRTTPTIKRKPTATKKKPVRDLNKSKKHESWWDKYSRGGYDWQKKVEKAYYEYKKRKKSSPKIKKQTTTKKRVHPRASEGYRYSTRNGYRVHKSRK